MFQLTNLIQKFSVKVIEQEQIVETSLSLTHFYLIIQVVEDADDAVNHIKEANIHLV